MSEGTYHSDCTNERDQPSRLAEKQQRSLAIFTSLMCTKMLAWCTDVHCDFGIQWVSLHVQYMVGKWVQTIKAHCIPCVCNSVKPTRKKRSRYQNRNLRKKKLTSVLLLHTLPPPLDPAQTECLYFPAGIQPPPEHRSCSLSHAKVGRRQNTNEYKTHLWGLGSFFLSLEWRIMRHFPIIAFGRDIDMPLKTNLQRAKGQLIKTEVPWSLGLIVPAARLLPCLSALLDILTHPKPQHRDKTQPSNTLV